jgi:C_GCAxxG_C_C family probable redox protein
LRPAFGFFIDNGEENMAVKPSFEKRMKDLVEREWDVTGIQERIVRLSKDGIPKKDIDLDEWVTRKDEKLEYLRRQAEENNYVLKNCAQSTALALMEEFGVGNMEIVKALAAFPGIASSGEVCGGITGSLIALGLCFGGDDRLDLAPVGKTIGLGREFMDRFEKEVGCTHCADILERIVLGHRLNPGESDESMATYAAEKGFEKCCLLPGTGAAIAAELIVENLKRGTE